MSYKIKDENNIPKYIEILEQLTSNIIEVGIFGESGSEILMIASVQEFGCDIQVTQKMRKYLHAMGLHLKQTTQEIHIPERSFIRSGFDDKESKIRNEANKLLERVLNLELNVNVFFETLGEFIVGQLQEYMTDLKTPPNHPFTIEQKGSSNPLIDTGRLRQSITFRIKRR